MAFLIVYRQHSVPKELDGKRMRFTPAGTKTSLKASSAGYQSNSPHPEWAALRLAAQVQPAAAPPQREPGLTRSAQSSGLKQESVISAAWARGTRYLKIRAFIDLSFGSRDWQNILWVR